MSSATTQPLNTPVGFTFPFFGATKTQIWIRQDGTISFSDGTPATPADPGANNADLSRTALAGEPAPPSDPTIAVLWDDLEAASTPGLAGRVLSRTGDDLDGDSLADLAVQWTDYRYVQDGGNEHDPISFQAVLYGNGQIQFNYLDIDSFPDGNSEPTGNETGGISATVGIWSGAPDTLTIDAGKLMPGPHSLGGTTFEFVNSNVPVENVDSNDSYLRMAWDTGGAVWDIGVVDAFANDGGINSPEANALRDAFVGSLIAQIDRADRGGEVFREDNVLLALNLGGPTLDGTGGTNNEGFVADDGVATLGAGAGALNSVTTTQDIDRFSNAIPDDLAQPVEDVFKTARTSWPDVLQIALDGDNPSYVGSNKSVVLSPTGTTGLGPSQFGYRAEVLSTPTFDDIGGSGFSLGLEGEIDAFAVLDIGNLCDFQFQYFGGLFDRLFVSTNALITFAEGDAAFNNVDWTLNLPTQAAIAALWDDLQVGTGAVLWQRLDEGLDDDRLVIQWEDVFYFTDDSTTDSITFQAVLFRDGRIGLNYQDLDSTGALLQSGGDEATVGIAAPADDVHITIDQLDAMTPLADGTYVVELFFAEIDAEIDAADRVFDVRLEGRTVLNDYDIFADHAKVVDFGTSTIELESDALRAFDGVVKRFLVDVRGGDGLQIDLISETPNVAPILNAVRIIEFIDPSADFDEDGDIDGDDFLAWQRAIVAAMPGAMLASSIAVFLQPDPGIIFVTSTDDEVDGDYTLGNLSLREAVQIANDVGTAMTIIVPAGRYELDLTGAEVGDGSYNDLDITGDIRIAGDGAGFTLIDGSALSGSHARLFDVVANGARLELSGVTLTTGGSLVTSGGGLAVQLTYGTTLELTDSAVVNHDAYDVAAVKAVGANVTVRRSVFTNNSSNYTTPALDVSGSYGSASLTIGSSIFALNQGGYYSATDTVRVTGSVTKVNEGYNLYDDASGGFFDTTPGTNDYVGTPDYVVTSATDTFDHADDGDALSLREAIDLANTDSGASEVWLPAWTFVLTRDRATYGTGTTDVDVSFGDLDVTDSLVVRGVYGQTGVQWSAGVNDAVFDLIGDFNQDGQADQTVNGSDFLAWQTQNGSGSVDPANWEQFSADADDDGDVDGADQALWSAYYGNTLDLFDILL
jgi:hypothetical protein